MRLRSRSPLSPPSVLLLLVLSWSLLALWRSVVGQEVATSPIQVSGSWNDGSAAGTWRANLSVTGTTLIGKLYLDNRPDLNSLDVSGELVGNSIEFGVAYNGTTVANFSGSLTDLSLSGTFMSGSRQGTWSGLLARELPQPPPAVDSDPQPVPPLPPPSLAMARSLPMPQDTPSPVSAGASSGDAESPLVDPTPCVNCLVNSSADGDAPQYEPEIAADRLNDKNRLLAVFIQDSVVGLPKTRYAFSTNRGDTWSLGSLNTLFGRQGDPVADFDLDGRPFAVHIGTETIQAPCNVPVYQELKLSYNTSPTNAFSSSTVIASSNASNSVFHDKPWLAINKAFSTYLHYVYVSWSYFTNCGNPGTRTSRILLNRSRDRGATFNFFPAVVSDDTASHLSSVVVDNAVASGVHVVWNSRANNQERILYDSCLEQADTTILCGTDTPVATVASLPLDSDNVNYLPGIDIRVTSAPSLAIDNGPGGDNDLYVVWNEWHNGNSDLYYSRKLAGQSNWSGKQAVLSLSNVDEFFPTVTYGDDHTLRLFFYRRNSNSASDKTFNAYIAKSDDNGSSWSQAVKVNNGGDLIPTTQIPDNNPPTNRYFIGDYNGIVQNEDRTDPTKTVTEVIWTDSRRLIGSGPDHQLDVFRAGGC